MIIGIDIDDTISETYAYLFPYAQKYTIEDLGKGIESIDRDCITYWNEKERKVFFEKYYEKGSPEYNSILDRFIKSGILESAHGLFPKTRKK